jgi:hypothetical protein
MQVEWRPRRQVKDFLEETVRDWLRTRPEYELTRLEYDGERLTVDLLGPGPIDTSALEAELRRTVGPTSPIDFWLTQRIRLSQ